MRYEYGQYVQRVAHVLHLIAPEELVELQQHRKLWNDHIVEHVRILSPIVFETPRTLCPN